MNHKTGYLYQDNFGNESDESGPVESWHRTFAGALRAKAANADRGAVYKILSDDSTSKVA